MRKFFAIVFMLVLALTFSAPAQAEFQDMWAQVYAQTGDSDPLALSEVNSGITFIVLASGADTTETCYVYGSDAYTSLANPVTTTNFNSTTYCSGKVKFRVDPTDTTSDRYVDLIVTNSNGGFTAFVQNFDKYTHKIVIDQRPNVMHHGCVPWFGTSGTGNVADTGIDFLYDTVVHAVRNDVVTEGGAESIQVGLLSTETSGDDDGFLINIVCTSAGAVTPSLANSGALLDDATNFYPFGHFIQSANAKSLVYSSYSTITSTNGYIHYWFTRVR